MPSMWMTLQAKYTDNLIEKVVRIFLTKKLSYLR